MGVLRTTAHTERPPALRPPRISARENAERAEVGSAHPSESWHRLAWEFAGAVFRFWLTVFPVVCLEHRRARSRARLIPDPSLRRAALDALHKWGNVEGAGACATSVTLTRRRHAIRAMVSFQAAYNYLDMLAEQPCSDPHANGRQLHQALLVALEPGVPHLDYYAHHHAHDDGGYLTEILDSCRASLTHLPSYGAVAPAARRAAERIVAFQSCNTGEIQGDYLALELWARAHTPAGMGLRWWETGASAGSSICVYALIAAAAEAHVDPAEIAAIECAYFPWIGALHSLLDNLVDAAEDQATGQRSLVDCYASPLEACTRMELLAQRSRAVAQELPGSSHTLVLAGMASFYLSTPEAARLVDPPITRSILRALGGPAALAMLVFRARLSLRRLGLTRRSRGAEIVLPDEVAEKTVVQ
jgi:tetraprenyl-beta-curcumene synthase